MAAKVGYIGVVPTKKWMNKHVFKSLNISTITEPELYDAVNRVMELVSTPLINIVTREGIKNADVDNIKVKDIVSCAEVIILVSNARLQRPSVRRLPREARDALSLSSSSDRRPSFVHGVWSTVSQRLSPRSTAR